MLSAREIFQEIRANDEAYRILMSAAARGEHQGGWENRRIAELTADADFAAKIRRHGEDESKHGRIFENLLQKRGLEVIELPIEADYCLQLESRGIGISHARLHRDEMLRPEEHLAYLAHSRVTEQRAAEEVAQFVKVFGDDPQLGPPLRMIADDEVNYLSFCHEELARFRSDHPELPIDRMLREYALEESRTYLRVGLDFIARISEILGWGRTKRGLLRAGVHALHRTEMIYSWRRFARIGTPERPGAMSAPHHEQEMSA